jgi:hypothetical protein
VVVWFFGLTRWVGTPAARLMSDFLPPRDWLGVAGSTKRS